MPRIDEIAQNGNTGRHYLVEKMAKHLAGEKPDMMLSGKKGIRPRWHDFIKQAIIAIEIVEEFQNG